MVGNLRIFLLVIVTGFIFLVLTCTRSYAQGTTVHPDGLIKVGDAPYIQKNDSGTSFFAGVYAGQNLAMPSHAVRNTGVGFFALGLGNNGSRNTAVGASALSYNIGSNNVAVGSSALELNTRGYNNVGVGYHALKTNQTGSDNIAIGNAAGENLIGDRNIAIGNSADPGDSGVIRIGTGSRHFATFIAGIRNATTGQANALPVLIDSQGQLGVISSSRRFKKDVCDMADTTNDLMKLRPVVFVYKNDTSKILQYGLIAEEVAEVYPELVTYSEDGRVETVRYHLLSCMLLNELQKQHRKAQLLEAAFSDYEARIARLESLLQKVFDDIH